MKIIAICGSPRKGNTEAMLREVLRGASSVGLKTEMILLRKMNVKRCCGCGCCEKMHRCVINDDSEKIYSKIFASDALVLGSPNYFNNVSGLMKDFIDHCDPHWQDKRWKKKKAIVVGVGGYNGDNAAKVLKEFSSLCGTKVIGSVSASADEAGSITKNKAVMKKCFELGKKVS